MDRERLCSVVCQERVGTWDSVAERKLGSWEKVGGAVGVAADEVSDEPL